MVRGVVTVVALLTLGCAGVTMKPLPSDPHAEDALGNKGIRFFRDAPFLLVYSDGKGGLTSQVLYLPDTTRKMSVRPYAFLASNETKLTFVEGVLTGQEVKVDETVVPKAALEAFETVASAALNAFNTAGTPESALLPAPGLFRIVVRGNQVTLAGPAVLENGQPLPPIHVTISAPATEDGK
jgi:hypothetical protein